MEWAVTSLFPSTAHLASPSAHQVLAPALVARGRVFESKLHLKGGDWRCRDKAYFDAPGRRIYIYCKWTGSQSISETRWEHQTQTSHPIYLLPAVLILLSTGTLAAPLSSNNDPIGISNLSSPLLPITTVFCSVEGGKHYATSHRADARDVDSTLFSVMMRYAWVGTPYFLVRVPYLLYNYSMFRYQCPTYVWYLVAARQVYLPGDGLPFLSPTLTCLLNQAGRRSSSMLSVHSDTAVSSF